MDQWLPGVGAEESQRGLRKLGVMDVHYLDHANGFPGVYVKTYQAIHFEYVRFIVY